MPRNQKTIDELDRKLIVLLNSDARITTARAAKTINRSREFTDYRIKKLIENKYFNGFTVAVSNKRLGFETFQILIKLQGCTFEEQKEMLAHLKQHPNVKILDRCSGAWDLLLKVVFKDKYYLVKFLDGVTYRFSQIILNYELLLDYIPIKHEDLSFITPLKIYKEKTRYSGRYHRDKKDLLILSALAKDSRVKITSLSKNTGIPIDTCITRLKRLTNEGIISSFKSLINFEKFNIQFYYVFMRLNKFSEEQRKTVANLFQNESQIVYAGRVIGNWDLAVQIAAKNQKEFDAQMNNIRTYLKYEIKQYSFAMVMENVKKELYPPGMR